MPRKVVARVTILSIINLAALQTRPVNVFVSLRESFTPLTASGKGISFGLLNGSCGQSSGNINYSSSKTGYFS